MDTYEEKYKEALKVIESLYNVVKYQSSPDALLTLQTIEKAFPELKESEDEEEELTEFEKNLQIIISEASHWTSDDGSISTYCQFGDKEIKKISGQLLDLARKELKESEDEKIRKEIIQSIRDDMCVIHQDKCIAWLEKQGQTFTKKDVDDAYLKGICDAKQELEKQGEQNPAWSEEDEEKFRDVIRLVEQGAPVQSIRDHYINWLKSLKPNHWKPSDEQMEALSNAISLLSVNPISDILDNLHDDLKKL